MIIKKTKATNMIRFTAKKGAIAKSPNKISIFFNILGVYVLSYWSLLKYCVSFVLKRQSILCSKK